MTAVQRGLTLKNHLMNVCRNEQKQLSLRKSKLLCSKYLKTTHY